MVIPLSLKLEKGEEGRVLRKREEGRAKPPSRSYPSPFSLLTIPLSLLPYPFLFFKNLACQLQISLRIYASWGRYGGDGHAYFVTVV